MQSCSQLCWQGGHVLPHQPQQPPPCRAPCLHCPSLAFPCHIHHISEVSFQGFISGMDGEGIFFTGRGKTKNLWGGRGGTRIVEPAWLWYSFPELRNRKETESSLGQGRGVILWGGAGGAGQGGAGPGRGTYYISANWNCMPHKRKPWFALWSGAGTPTSHTGRRGSPRGRASIPVSYIISGGAGWHFMI